MCVSRGHDADGVLPGGAYMEVTRGRRGPLHALQRVHRAGRRTGRLQIPRPVQVTTPTTHGNCVSMATIEELCFHDI